MQRRFFLALTAIAAASPVVLWAQQTKKLPRIGVLVGSNPEPFLSLFQDGLRKLGYVEGKTAQIEFRSAEGKMSLLPGMAAELVRLKVDIIVALQTPAVQAAKQATSEIPIVMAGAGDPVGTGLVASLARPGGNVTGLSATTADLGGKLLELILEIRPSAKRVAVLANVTDPFMRPFLEQIQIASRAMAIETPAFLIREAEELNAAFSEMTRRQVKAIVVQPSLPRKAVVDLALKHRLPAISPSGGFPDDGGLISYSAKPPDIYREAAAYVDKILKGAKPADLPVQQPTKFELVVNLKTAKAIGVTIPKSVLARADRVIE